MVLGNRMRKFGLKVFYTGHAPFGYRLSWSRLVLPVIVTLSLGQAGFAETAVSWGSPQDTCTANGTERELAAPKPQPLESVFSTDPDVSAKLAKRRTVNVAGPWLDLGRHDINDYGVAWHSWNDSPGGDAIWMREVLWVNYKPERKDNAYKFHLAGLEEFVTKDRWQSQAEYGASYRLAIEDPAYPDYLAQTVQDTLAQTGADGILLDWWIDKQPYLTEAEVKAARGRIAKAIRSRIGPGPVIMGNTGWTREASTHADLNGVFMELWKKPSKRGYSCAELLRIEDLLAFHDQNLAQPKIVVLEPWRQAKSSSTSDRTSKKNLAWASMFTAMAAVVPRNGYILYADNARDRSGDDHGHSYYDIYNIDLGHPVSGRAAVAKGIGYRMFEKGVIAYNATPGDVTLTIDGKPLQIKALRGAFCESAGDGWDCRS